MTTGAGTVKIEPVEASWIFRKQGLGGKIETHFRSSAPLLAPETRKRGQENGVRERFPILHAWPDSKRADGWRFAEMESPLGGDAPGGVAWGVLDSGPFRYRVGRGHPDEGVTMISREQPSPASETATHAAFIEGFGE